MRWELKWFTIKTTTTATTHTHTKKKLNTEETVMQKMKDKEL